MHKYYPSIFSFLGAIPLLIIWWIYLFTAQPDCLSSFVAAKESLLFALDPNTSGTWIFLFIIASIISCICCGFLFLKLTYAKFAFSIVFIHVLLSAMYYDLTLVAL